MFRACYIPLVLLSVSGIRAADAAQDSSFVVSEALESAFRISPVYWDQNISVVDICGCESDATTGMLPWPASTGELLQLMDALKYEYEMRSFQCVVFSLVTGQSEPDASKMLNALSECVTMCDMLRIPLRIAIGRDGNWLELTPTYPVSTARNLMIPGNVKRVLREADGTIVKVFESLKDVPPLLKGSNAEPEPVNIFWKPSTGNLAEFVELIEAFHHEDIEYSLHLLP
ncbi:MAG: hypothetical protein E7033_04575 [Akkermansiaceae bacterium]|nr:hypothetical protein [Akkermansiaceae bacterium]